MSERALSAAAAPPVARDTSLFFGGGAEAQRRGMGEGPASCVCSGSSLTSRAYIHGFFCLFVCFVHLSKFTLQCIATRLPRMPSS